MQMGEAPPPLSSSFSCSCRGGWSSFSQTEIKTKLCKHFKNGRCHFDVAWLMELIFAIALVEGLHVNMEPSATSITRSSRVSKANSREISDKPLFLMVYEMKMYLTKY